MTRGTGAARYVVAYALLVLVALAVPLVPPAPPARAFWVEFGVALGFVGLAMIWLQFMLTARFRNVAAPLGLDTMLQFHGQAGAVAIGFALAHPVLLFLAEPGFVAYLDPRVSSARALALGVLIVTLVLLALLTFKRRPLGIPYEWWRATHGLLGFAVLFLGTVHVFRVGWYIAVPWKQAVWLSAAAAAAGLLVQTRVIRPLRLRRRPYRVVDVREERGDAWTLELEPDGHRGLSFEAGQFAWLTLGPSPFSIQQHPFSFSSSALRPERLAMTVKELGDFTSTIGTVRPGTRAFLEGPYGAFTFDPAAPGGVFIAGGVGITPFMSMLRTLADAGDTRPLLLIYGTSSPERTLFLDELGNLERRLNLRIVHVFEEPPAAWGGERGRPDEGLLARHLPPPESRHQVLICGPEPMMDVAELAVRRSGVPSRRIRSERFSIV